MFFKVINNKPLKRGFKRLSGFYAALLIRELVNWWFRFLMSQTGYTCRCPKDLCCWPCIKTNKQTKLSLLNKNNGS